MSADNAAECQCNVHDGNSRLHGYPSALRNNAYILALSRSHRYVFGGFDALYRAYLLELHRVVSVVDARRQPAISAVFLSYKLGVQLSF